MGIHLVQISWCDKMWPLDMMFILTLVFLASVHDTASGRKTSGRARRSTTEGQSEGWCGLPGLNGRDGRDGAQGPYGPPGQKGEQGPPGQSSRLDQKIEEILSYLRNQHRDAVRCLTPGGAVYTRWGRTSCPNDAQKLYDGVVAGSHYTHTGSGANYLCLPLNPQWNRTVEGHQSGSFLYGTEFEINEGNTGFHRSNSDGKSQHDHEAVCSVCHTPGRQSHVMIPARLQCPSGWTLEYMGFLMSAHHTEKQSEYVCVDQDPEVHPATAGNKDGALFYVTEVVCGSLPCPPYVNGYEVTCVVCTS